MNELSLHILDICQNSISANASLIEVLIDEDTIHNTFTITIKDNGKGMNKQTLSQVSDPFFTTRTTRKVGMGISLFQLAAEQCDGSLLIESEEHKGTTIKTSFKHDHIDRAPLGKIEDTIMILLLNEADIDILYQHRYNDKEFILDSRDIKETLEGIPLTNPDVVLWVKQYIKDGLTTIHKEVAT